MKHYPIHRLDGRQHLHRQPSRSGLILHYPAAGVAKFPVDPGGAKGLVVGIIVMSTLCTSCGVGRDFPVPDSHVFEPLGLILVLVFAIWESVAVFKTVSLTRKSLTGKYWAKARE
ncbi:hypothetical protein ACW185_00835 [Limosilactobacillus fermentum]